MITVETARAALVCIRTDMDLLESGEWVPDSDSIDATRDMLDTVDEFLTTVVKES